MVKKTEIKTSKKITACISGAMLALTSFAAAFATNLNRPETAYATPSAVIKEERDKVAQDLAKMQEELEKASDDYTAAMYEKESAEAKIKENEEAIEGAQQEIEKVRGKLSYRVKDMYKNNQSDVFVQLVLGADTLSGMLDNWNMLSSLNDNDSNIISRARDLKSDVAARQSETMELAMLAAEKSEEMEAIKSEAEAKSQEMQTKLDKLDNEYREQIMREIESYGGNGNTDPSAKSGAGRGIPTNGSVVDFAASRLGCPYVWGAEGPNAFDCSGLVMWCYRKTGKKIPHNTEYQKRAAKAIIPVSEAEPGDVLYRYGHVGIYIGGGKYIHAPHTGDVVRIASGGRWTCALRF